jgi:hypothetical protein
MGEELPNYFKQNDEMDKEMLVMAKEADFDIEAAHRYFAAACFNQAWDLIEKKERTPEEDEQMIRLNQASIYHWTQRQDFGLSNLSIGYWQAARIYTLVGRLNAARHYAELCLAVSQGENIPTFCLGYAYEALARVEAAVGEREKYVEYRFKGNEIAGRIEDEEDRKQLLADLNSI